MTSVSSIFWLSNANKGVLLTTFFVGIAIAMQNIA
jgi:hypothetical protein